MPKPLFSLPTGQPQDDSIVSVSVTMVSEMTSMANIASTVSVNSARSPLLPPARSVKHWSLTTLWEELIKIGAKVVRHAKYVALEVAEVAVPRELLAAFLKRIQRFGVPPPMVRPA